MRSRKNLRRRQLFLSKTTGGSLAASQRFQTDPIVLTFNVSWPQPPSTSSSTIERQWIPVYTHTSFASTDSSSPSAKALFLSTAWSLPSPTSKRYCISTSLSRTASRLGELSDEEVFVLEKKTEDQLDWQGRPSIEWPFSHHIRMVH
ncbi:hypothetical protein ARMSODRAFT_541799 [Armillaria solidipes]|uniref:Uncharacterized protein n=1 Tax=Armillaria solidipes TaxID=1076256 RepID=A0A2H3BJZ6_9AGAR|nr:hypothetical protein ARMSODRAFT_541799 [Armillaria solidipes]